jgi:hypothetical protein
VAPQMDAGIEGLIWGVPRGLSTTVQADRTLAEPKTAHRRRSKRITFRLVQSDLELALTGNLGQEHGGHR